MVKKRFDWFQLPIPRKGTETLEARLKAKAEFEVSTTYSPQGDGNTSLLPRANVEAPPSRFQLPIPRKGTETTLLANLR